MRTPTTLKIKFKSVAIEDFIERYSVDVSRGGIFIRTKKPLDVGTPLKFEFQLQDGASIMNGDGTVAWARSEEAARPNAAPGMGVRFDRVAGSSLLVLDRILSDKERRGERSEESRFEAGQRDASTAAGIIEASPEERDARTPLPSPIPGLNRDVGTPLPSPMPGLAASSFTPSHADDFDSDESTRVMQPAQAEALLAKSRELAPPSAPPVTIAAATARTMFEMPAPVLPSAMPPPPPPPPARPKAQPDPAQYPDPFADLAEEMAREAAAEAASRSARSVEPPPVIEPEAAIADAAPLEEEAAALVEEQAAAPVDAAAATVETFAAPVETFAAPVETFPPPVETFPPPVETFAAPVETFAAPVETFAAPVETPAPHVEEPVAAVDAFAPPAEAVVPSVDVVEPLALLADAFAAQAGSFAPTTDTPAEAFAFPDEALAPPAEVVAPTTEPLELPAEVLAPLDVIAPSMEALAAVDEMAPAHEAIAPTDVITPAVDEAVAATEALAPAPPMDATPVESDGIAGGEATTVDGMAGIVGLASEAMAATGYLGVEAPLVDEPVMFAAAGAPEGESVIVDGQAASATSESVATRAERWRATNAFTAADDDGDAEVIAPATPVLDDAVGATTEPLFADGVGTAAAASSVPEEEQATVAGAAIPAAILEDEAAGVFAAPAAVEVGPLSVDDAPAPGEGMATAEEAQAVESAPPAEPAPAVEAEVAEAEVAEAEVAEADVLEAEVAEADVLEAEVLEADVVEVAAVEAAAVEVVAVEAAGEPLPASMEAQEAPVALLSTSTAAQPEPQPVEVAAAGGAPEPAFFEPVAPAAAFHAAPSPTRTAASNDATIMGSGDLAVAAQMAAGGAASEVGSAATMIKMDGAAVASSLSSDATALLTSTPAPSSDATTLLSSTPAPSGDATALLSPSTAAVAQAVVGGIAPTPMPPAARQAPPAPRETTQQVRKETQQVRKEATQEVRKEPAQKSPAPSAPVAAGGFPWLTAAMLLLALAAGTWFLAPVLVHPGPATTTSESAPPSGH